MKRLSTQSEQKLARERLEQVLRETGGALLRGEHGFSDLPPEDKLRAVASLAEFVYRYKGSAIKVMREDRPVGEKQNVSN